MKSKKLIILSTVLAGITSFASVSTLAGPEHKKHRHLMMKNLDLSEQQRMQMKQFHQQSKQSRQASNDRMRAIKQQVRETMNAEQFNQGQLRDLLIQQANVKADIMVEQRANREQMKTLLTKQQQNKLQQLKSEAKERREARKEYKKEHRKELREEKRKQRNKYKKLHKQLHDEESHG